MIAAKVAVISAVARALRNRAFLVDQIGACSGSADQIRILLVNRTASLPNRENRQFRDDRWSKVYVLWSGFDSKTAQNAGQNSQRRRHIPAETDWVAEEPVSSERVSGQNSLLTGKLTGIHADGAAPRIVKARGFKLLAANSLTIVTGKKWGEQ